MTKTTQPERLADLLAEDARQRAATQEPKGLGHDQLSDDELVHYLEGELEPAQEARIQTLAVSDPEVAQRLLDLQDLLAAETAPAAAAEDLATAAGWRDFQARRREPGQAATLPSQRLSRQLSRRLFPWAAVLLLAAVNLGGWMTYTSRLAPRLVANLTSLQLAEPGRSESPPVAEVAEGEPLRLVLRPEARCESFRALVRGPEKGPPREVPGLLLDDLSLLTLLLPVQGGDYRLELFGCDPERPLEEYRFRVRRPNAASPSAP